MASIVDFESRLLDISVSSAKNSMKFDIFKTMTNYKRQSSLLSSKYIPHYLKIAMLNSLQSDDKDREKIIDLCYCIHCWSTEQMFYNGIVRKILSKINGLLKERSNDLKINVILLMMDDVNNNLLMPNDEDYEFYIQRFNNGINKKSDGLDFFQKNFVYKTDYKSSILRRFVDNLFCLTIKSILNTTIENIVDSTQKIDEKTNTLLERLIDIHLNEKSVDDILIQHTDTYENHMKKFCEPNDTKPQCSDSQSKNENPIIAEKWQTDACENTEEESDSDNSINTVIERYYDERLDSSSIAHSKTAVEDDKTTESIEQRDNDDDESFDFTDVLETLFKESIEEDFVKTHESVNNNINTILDINT